MSLGDNVHVGGAVLEWRQAAQNAAIYLYIDDPAGPQHEVCPESMSLAVFPGQGAQARKTIENNKPSYFNPMVTLIEPPIISAVPIKSGSRTIDTVQLEAVVVDLDGHNRRQKMIGYARGADFVRVMTGVLDDPECANAASKSFMAKLAALGFPTAPPHKMQPLPLAALGNGWDNTENRGKS